MIARRLSEAGVVADRSLFGIAARAVQSVAGPQLHGEYTILLTDGTTIVSGRSYRARIQQAFGLGRGEPD